MAATREQVSQLQALARKARRFDAIRLDLISSRMGEVTVRGHKECTGHFDPPIGSHFPFSFPVLTFLLERLREPWLCATWVRWSAALLLFRGAWAHWEGQPGRGIVRTCFGRLGLEFYFTSWAEWPCLLLAWLAFSGALAPFLVSRGSFVYTNSLSSTANAEKTWRKCVCEY